MEKNIYLEGDCLRIIIKNCTHAEFFKEIANIDFPLEATMSSVMFGDLKEGHCIIRCNSLNELEAIKNKLS